MYGQDNRTTAVTAGERAGARRCRLGLECTADCARGLSVNLSPENEHEVLPAGSEPCPLLHCISALCCGACRSADILCYRGSRGLGEHYFKTPLFQGKRSTKTCVGFFGKISSVSVPTRKVSKTRERTQTSQKRTVKEKIHN